MKRILKYSLIGVPLLAVGAAAGVAGFSEWRLTRTYPVAMPVLAVTPTAKMADEGTRLAGVLGCMGCHREAGNTLFAKPGVGRLVAPNLSRVATDYSDAELARLIRQGVKRDGTSVIAMPTGALSHLSDEDVAAVISWLRTLTPREDSITDRTAWGPLGRVALALHKVPMGADAVQDPAPPAMRPHSGDSDEGRYLVSVTCRACHQLHAPTDDGFGMVTPALVDMVAAYPIDAFQTLLTTGTALGGREVGLMSEIARGDSVHMTDAERAAIHTYLLSGQANDDE